MTVSMRVMSAGDGYAYLLRTVVTGDGNTTRLTAMTRYYTEEGTPPGIWMGSGVSQFGAGELLPGMTVTPEQLQTLMGKGADPLTGDQLGRPYRRPASVEERTTRRVAKLDRGVPSEEFDAVAARITAEEIKRGPMAAVAGFDLTFSVPKSVSVLWAVADAGTQEQIVEAHHAAVAQVIDFLEREVAATRVGTNGIAQVEVLGVAATAFDHYDSRANDPQLHTHVVVSNKVRTAVDGKWRTLDSRALHHAVVALSEYYNAVLADRLTGTFGLSWDQRGARGEARNPTWEIVGVSDELIAEFSSRSRAIDIATEELAQEYMSAHHGRRPPDALAIRMRARATLETRPEKSVYSLADLTGHWRERAEPLLGEDPTGWGRRLTLTSTSPVFRADNVPDDVIGVAGTRVVAAVAEKRSTWRHWNLWAEASRQTMGWRFATVEDREAIVAAVTEAAADRSVMLTPPELTPTPECALRADGESAFCHRHEAFMSSQQILAMEDRLLHRAEETTAPALPAALLRQAVTVPHDGVTLTPQQASALEAVATSSRQVDVLVGPAGAGKTTAMRALRAAWTAQHGGGSVVGLAPSAAAAQVLAEDLGITTENTAKWLYEHDHGRANFRRGQLVIVDEATLASTRTLDRLTGLAEQAGAKVLLVGDWAQLQSVDAGGAFAMLVNARGQDIPELTEVHRFTHEWEQHASLELRRGEVDVIDTYAGHDRLREGSTTEMIDVAYGSWRDDLAAGRSSILVTDSAESVRQLNERARAERVHDGQTSTGREAMLANEARCSVGDIVITRRNNRRLRTSRTGWVRNGDRWQVTGVRGDGSIEVRRAARQLGATVILPADYVAENVDLGYAVTAHRAQGMTVDTSHVVVSGSTTRENLYVAMTRGRETNIAYVPLDRPDDAHVPPERGEISARTVLFGVLHHTGLELSAHQTITDEQNKWTGIAQVAAEYDHIATTAQRERWQALVQDALTGAGRMTESDVEAAIASDAFGALAAELRRAEANRYDVAALLSRVIAERTLLDADDTTAVLSYRVAQAAPRPVGSGEGDLIAGLVPEVLGPVPPDVRAALDARRDLIEARAAELAETAVRVRAPWVQRIGDPPLGASDRARWKRQLAIVAAHRERYDITSRDPLGTTLDDQDQRHDAVHAIAALRRARALSNAPMPNVPSAFAASLAR
ncbi:MobF family relaxase [Georgenia subflava]|uniref:Relaxase domain-containing protein n=1 Tax=Georgenia subflava TaxID=1622177 RepID=A0A6N7EGZ1_9MICO|nr:MobF family relaxase [Georgenia subflava]MPV35967.1 relaxase domain-containing protein [Georgenia subflava]